MLNKIFSGVKLIQEKTNTTTALVIPMLLIESLFIIITKGSVTSSGSCLLNNAKLIGFSFGSEYLNNKFEISDVITEKCGEEYGKFTALGMSALADIAMNFAVYGLSQLTPDHKCSLLKTVLLTGLDLAKLSAAEAIDHGYVDFSEVYSDLLAVDQQQGDL
jgi:hypothetical protein